MLFSSGTALALSRDAALGDFRRTDWGARDGAPNAIVAIAQTRDGYLWLANSNGLFRFDGLHFERHELPRDERISSTNIYELFAPDSGGLWIGFTFGGVAFLKDGQLTVHTERDGLPPGSVKAIEVDGDGTVWVGTTTGLARLGGSRWLKTGPAEGYAGTDTEGILADSAGTLWVVTSNKVFLRERGKSLFRELPLHLPKDTDPGLAESPTGDVWMSTPDRLQRLRKNPNPARRVSSTGPPILFDRDGGLWSRENGGGVRRIAHPEGMKDTSWARAKVQLPSYSEDGQSPGELNFRFFEDREGNVWATSVKGLTRYAEPRVARLLTDAPGFNPSISAFAAGDDGLLWMFSRSARPFGLRDGKVRRRGDPGPFSCAIRADDGSVWFGGSDGLHRFVGDRVEHMALPSGTADFDVQALAVTRTGDVWTSIVRRGVFRFSAGVWTPYGGVAGLPELTAVTLSTDAAGRVWFGYTEGRVAMLDGVRLTVFAGRDALPIGNVTALHGKGSQVWAGGEFGLALLDGTTFRPILSERRMPFNHVTGIVETADGELWVNSGAGIVRFSAAEVRHMVQDPSHRPQVEVFDAADGVEGTSARLRPLPSALEGTDGKLWFLTDAGLYAIHPARIHRNPLPPPVRIETLSVGDTTVPLDGGVTLVPGTTTVRIGYAGLSLTLAEKVQYRYRLDGVDADWQAAGRRREAFYADLRPGTYRFQVIAANNDGVWNTEGATLQFTIPPMFFQTGWFLALCVVCAGMLVWAAVRLRVRQVGHRMQDRYEERMAERERIARELHDTLLQGTQGLVLRFQSAVDGIAVDDPARAGLNKALDRAEAMITEGRERVLDLRVAAEPLGELPEAYASTGEAFGADRGVTFRTSVEGTPRPLRPVAKAESYRIGREALLNAFRHAGAGLIEVQVVYAADALCIRIRDDGIGLEARLIETASLSHHCGIRGMLERAKRIGARLHFRPRPGAGTEVELSIPAATAYAVPARTRWFARHPAPSADRDPA